MGTLNARRAELEEVELEIMMRVDEIKARITDLQTQEADFTAQINDLNIGKENALAKINGELESIAKSEVKLWHQYLVNLLRSMKK